MWSDYPLGAPATWSLLAGDTLTRRGEQTFDDLVDLISHGSADAHGGRDRARGSGSVVCGPVPQLYRSTRSDATNYFVKSLPGGFGRPCILANSLLTFVSWIVSAQIKPHSSRSVGVAFASVFRNEALLYISWGLIGELYLCPVARTLLPHKRRGSQRGQALWYVVRLSLYLRAPRPGNQMPG